jgi:hypothetical protein
VKNYMEPVENFSGFSIYSQICIKRKWLYKTGDLLKEVNLIKLNIYLLYGYFQQNQCLNIKKHAIYIIHRLAWDPYARGPPGQTLM